MSAAPACACGSERVTARAGSVVRVGVRGEYPHSADFQTDPFETAEARCAGCGAVGGAAQAAALDAAAARAGSRRLGVSYGEEATAEQLPMDEPLCGCGSTAASLVLYGDSYVAVHGAAIVGEAYSPRADPDAGSRWECAFRPFAGCRPPTAAVAATRAAAELAVRAFLDRVPILRAGPEPLPAGALSGWPARLVRIRSVPARFPEPVAGMTYMDEAWLERPRGVDHAAALVRAGFSPMQLRAQYPSHRAAGRSGRGSDRCGGTQSSTWQHTGLEPGEALRWLEAGVWPCCASRYSEAGLGAAAAAQWIAAEFMQPDEAAGWDRLRFGAAEARAWADAGVTSAESARACRDAGLTPRSVLTWAWVWGGRRARSPRRFRGPSPGHDDLAWVLAWRRAGLDGRQAGRWDAAGFTPEEAARLPPGHPERPTDQDLAAMAAVLR